MDFCLVMSRAGDGEECETRERGGGKEEHCLESREECKKNSMRIPVSRLQNNARPRKRVSPPIAEFVQISGIQRVNAIMNDITYIEDLRQMRAAQYWKL